MKKLLTIIVVSVLLVMSFAVIANAADYVYYENDFSSADSLKDFKQIRGEWSIVDGKLMLTGVGNIGMEEQAFLLFNKDAGIMNLTDYVAEVDVLNLQTQCGIIFRCDIDKADAASSNSFYGYQAFFSFTGEKAVLCRGNLLGDWGGNLKVSDNLTAPGSNLHIKATCEGSMISVLVTDLDSGAELWNYTTENKEWGAGSFGIRACVMHDALINLNQVAFDNLKITARGKVGDHLAAGKALKDFAAKVVTDTIKVTPAIKLTVPKVEKVDASKLDLTKTEYVFYENDFSNAKTLSDFTQYRGDWSIKNGKLYYSAVTTGFEATGNFSFILYTKNHDANLLKEYTVEVDIMNSQSAAGIISHADLSKACSSTSNSFYGYLSFISNDGTKGAVGYGNDAGNWGGNLKVEPDLLSPGNNYHLKVEHKADQLIYTITEVGKSEVIWTDTEAATDWTAGSFGFRSISTKDALTNLGKVGFDNLKVTVYGDQAILLNAGYHPNAEIVGDRTAKPVATTPSTTTNDKPAAATTAAESAAATGAESTEVNPDASAETTETGVASETVETTETGAASAVVTSDAPETIATVASGADSAVETDPAAETTETPAEKGGANVGLIIGIVVAAIAVVAAVVFFVLKKKKK